MHVFIDTDLRTNVFSFSIKYFAPTRQDRFNCTLHNVTTLFISLSTYFDDTYHFMRKHFVLLGPFLGENYPDTL